MQHSHPAVEVFTALAIHVVKAGHALKIIAEVGQQMIAVEVVPATGDHALLLGRGGATIGALVLIARAAAEKTGHKLHVVVSDETTDGSPNGAEYDWRVIHELLKGVMDKCASRPYVIEHRAVSSGVRFDVKLSSDERESVRNREFGNALALVFDEIGMNHKRVVMVDVWTD